MKQEFQGPIQHVAGRDVVIHAAQPPREWQVQATFAEATGIHCPAQAREVLEDLIANHGFTARELKQAWGTSLKWDRATSALRVSTPLATLIFSWAFFAVASLLFLSVALPAAFSHDLPAAARYVTSIAFYIGSSWAVGRWLMEPRRIGLRVRAAIASARDGTVRA